MTTQTPDLVAAPLTRKEQLADIASGQFFERLTTATFWLIFRIFSKRVPKYSCTWLGLGIVSIFSHHYLTLSVRKTLRFRATLGRGGGWDLLLIHIAVHLAINPQGPAALLAGHLQAEGESARYNHRWPTFGICLKET
jgi:hypothetical protein